MQKFKKKNVADVLKFCNTIAVGYLTIRFVLFHFLSLEPEELLYIAIFFSALHAKKVTFPSQCCSWVSSHLYLRIELSAFISVL